MKWSRERTGNAFGSGKLLDEISRPLISYSPLRRETYLSPFSRQSIIIAAVVHGARAFSVLVSLLDVITVRPDPFVDHEPGV